MTAAAAQLPELDMEPGLALDFTTTDEDGNPWDFDQEHMREKALKLVDETKPELLIGSPMCKLFCTWQRINRYGI